VKYIKPAVADFGSLADITEATAITGLTEDSLNKAIPIHHNPPTSGPPGP
jgi:hypothetical protein